MENPAHWNDTVKVIDAAIQEWEQSVKDMTAIAFRSLPMHIYTKLLDKGLLHEKD